MALRIVAVTRGIVQIYADRTDWAGNLAETMMTRFDTFIARLPIDPRDQAIVTYDSQPQSVMVEKQSIMRDLDRLLATVAGKAIDVDMVQTALVDILQRVFDLDTPGGVESQRPGT